MASSLYLFVFLIAIAILVSASHAQDGLNLPIRKDPKTTQYYTTVRMGSTRAVVNAVIDLGGQYLWFDCDNYTSSTFAPIPCDSQQCGVAKGVGCVGCNNSPPRPGCTNDTCGASVYNPFQDVLVSQGYELDTLFTDNGDQLARFPYACMNTRFSEGLASGASGMLGLARTNISLHKKVADTFGVPDKFSVCLPSSGRLGKLNVGGEFSSVAKSLISTPLLINPVSTAPSFTVGDPSDEYFINVQSIKVNGQPLSSVKSSYFSIDENGVGGTKISTRNNFTALHSSIYKPLTRAFVKAASDMGIKTVDNVEHALFGACFDAATVGPSVPVIELVLPGNDVSWKIHGANSMYSVSKNVKCLGFVDGGSRPRTSVVIGGYQLEDNVVEFDLVSSQLRFSSSLLLQNKSCSRL